MDFEYTEDEKTFQREVREFIKDNRDPDVMDPRREAMAQLVDTPKRRQFVNVAPLRHPLQAAKSLATLDVLAGGRAIWGVGAGHVEEEFELTGADFSRRGALLDELRIGRRGRRRRRPPVSRRGVRPSG